MAYCFSIITQVVIEIHKQRNDRKMYVENYIFLVTRQWTTTRTDHMVIHHMVHGQNSSNFCTFYNTFCLQEKGQKVAKICLTRSQSTVKFSQRPLFTFTLKVNEQFWKFPEGRIAPGLRPFDDRKFSSCLVNRGLCSPEGCCARTEDGAVTAPEVDQLSSPWLKEVRAAGICLTWSVSVRRSP